MTINSSMKTGILTFIVFIFFISGSSLTLERKEILEPETMDIYTEEHLISSGNIDARVKPIEASEWIKIGPKEINIKYYENISFAKDNQHPRYRYGLEWNYAGKKYFLNISTGGGYYDGNYTEENVGYCIIWQPDHKLKHVFLCKLKGTAEPMFYININYDEKTYNDYSRKR